MSKNTNLQEIINLAKAFLHIDYSISSFGKAILIHPVFNSAIQPYQDAEGNLLLLDIVESKEDYQKIIESWEKRFDKCTSPEEVFLLIQKSHRLTFFKYASPYLSKKDFSILLGEVWTDSENPNMDINVSIKESADFFKKADKTFLMDKEEHDYYKTLPNTLTVYRGVAVGRVEDGLSWTANREKALWFSGRFSTAEKKGYLISGTVEKKHILAYFNRRDEDELVIYPRNVKQKKISKP